jgi:subtilase family serine protease
VPAGALSPGAYIIDNTYRTSVSSSLLLNHRLPRGIGILALSVLRSAAAAIALATAAVPVAAAFAGDAPPQSVLPAAAAEPVTFDLFLPSRDSAGLARLLADQQNPATVDYQRWLTPEEFTQRFGADPTSLAGARAIMASAGFTVVETLAQGLRVTGTVGALQARFGVTLDHVVTAAGKESLVARGGFALPDALQALGAGIAAFAPNRKQVYSQRLPHAVPENRNSPTGGYWFSDLKQAYDAPSYQSLAGTGRNIAILISSDVLDTDMELYFGHEKLAEPNLIHIPINGGSPFSATSDDSLEATLDVQQSGGMAPKATILLYDIPSLSDADIMTGLQAILADNRADVVSMSFGECELFFTAAYNGGVSMTGLITLYEQLFQQGNAQGITFVAASGDNGALQCPSLTKPIFIEGASSPATSPEVTAVGGTNLVTTFTPGSQNSAYVEENADGDPLVPNAPFGGTPLTGGIWGSGGGPSIFFGRPAYQVVTTGTAARATPDLALHMGGCPSTAILPCGPDRSFDIEILAAETVGVIGTSAAAPAFAGVVALLDQLTHARHGNVNPMIYSLANAEGTKLTGGAFRRLIPGFNGVFSSGQPVPEPGIIIPKIPDYNMVVGAGSVDIRQFLGATKLPAAGVPGTASNP